MLPQSPRALAAPSAGIAALALVCACALPGCSSSTAFPEVGQDRATTANSVLALRIGNSPGVGADAYSTGVGRLLLVDGAGTGNSVDVGAMIDAGLVWDASGLHYGTSGAEVAVSDSGTTSVPRGKDERHELSRYSIDDGAASLAFYIDGDQQDAVAVTADGTRDLVPMAGDDGSPIAFSPGHLDWLVGHLSGSAYTFVTSYGEVYSTDLGTGTTRPLFTVPLTDPDSQASRFTVDAQNVFTLDVPADSEAPLTLRRDPLDGGGGEVLLTVDASPVRKGTFLTGGPLMVQAFALRPAYMEGFAR